MIRANLLIATAQNKQAMNFAVEQAARHFLKPAAGGGFAEGNLNRLEAAIRCFDPCLSCSTHALGRMPLVVEWTGPMESYAKSSATEPRVLLIALGNPLRGDDGVAQEVLALLAPRSNVFTEAPLDILPEMAAALAGFDLVVFIDADVRPSPSG